MIGWFRFLLNNGRYGSCISPSLSSSSSVVVAAAGGSRSATTFLLSSHNNNIRCAATSTNMNNILWRRNNSSTASALLPPDYDDDDDSFEQRSSGRHHHKRKNKGTGGGPPRHRRERRRNEQTIDRHHYRQHHHHRERHRHERTGKRKPPPKLFYYVEPEPAQPPKFCSSILGTSWTSPSKPISQDQTVFHVLKNGCSSSSVTSKLQQQQKINQNKQIRPSSDGSNHDKQINILSSTKVINNTVDETILDPVDTTTSSNVSSQRQSKISNIDNQSPMSPNGNEKRKKRRRNTKNKKMVDDQTVVLDDEDSNSSKLVLEEKKNGEIKTSTNNTKIVRAGQNADTPWWKTLKESS